MTVTKLSTRGQVVLPKTVRDGRGWRPGTEFVVEETASGVLLRPQRPFAPTRFEDVRGSLKYEGRPKTIGEMNRGIAKAVKERHARGRY
ncbi:MAG TPA: AbrB/MazE/SpoVT family DNA-binding domain-containing protein [Terriglobia bacterium]|nr:AbrB/MazE/SpoVT family DNA-binding domain-containing protein [Terriglobia bacterium]